MMGKMLSKAKNQSTRNSGARFGGALSRLASRVAPQAQKNPRATRRNHMVRNSGPIKNVASAVTDADRSISDTGEGLRRLVGRVASRGRVAAAKGGKIKRYAEGGKVGSAMSALRLLAKKYQEALEMGDTALAKRIKRQMEIEKSGGSRNVEPSRRELEVGQEKAATFSKGGKVKGLKKLVKAVRARMDDREGYIREGFGKTREEAYKNLRKEVAYDNGEDTVDGLLKEHGVTYKQRRE